MPPGQGFSDGYVVHCPSQFGNTGAYCQGGIPYCIELVPPYRVYANAPRCAKCPTCDASDNLNTANAYIALCPANLGLAWPYCYNRAQYCINIDTATPYPDASFCSFGTYQCPTCDINGMLVVPPTYYASCSQAGYVPSCNVQVPGCFNLSTFRFNAYAASCLSSSGG